MANAKKNFTPRLNHLKLFSSVLLLLTLPLAIQSFATSVSSPSNGSTVGTKVAYTATADGSSCSQGIASMGIYVDSDLKFVGSGNSLSTSLNLSVGKHRSVVQAWDYCGGAVPSTPVFFTVSPSGSAVQTIDNIQAAGSWNQWGELAPVYDICSPCSGVTWSMSQHISDNSISGDATRFTIGGKTPYSDVLWSNKLLGQGSTQGVYDRNHTLLPTIHNLTYDTQVYVSNLSVTQDLEFDVNMYMDGVGMEWGLQCNHLADGMWDYWNNVQTHWVATNVPCNLKEGAWNHVSFQSKRKANNDLVYQTLTVNGRTSVLNITVAPFKIPVGWWGMTVNYQMDGNHKQQTNTTMLDNFSVSYW